MYFIPSKEYILGLQVGDLAPYVFGTKEVVRISARNQDLRGNWFVCYHVSTDLNSSSSGSMKEGELHRCMALTTQHDANEITCVEQALRRLLGVKLAPLEWTITQAENRLQSLSCPAWLSYWFACECVVYAATDKAPLEDAWLEIKQCIIECPSQPYSKRGFGQEAVSQLLSPDVRRFFGKVWGWMNEKDKPFSWMIDWPRLLIHLASNGSFNEEIAHWMAQRLQYLLDAHKACGERLPYLLHEGKCPMEFHFNYDPEERYVVKQ